MGNGIWVWGRQPSQKHSGTPVLLLPQKPTCRPSCSVFLVLSSFSPPPAPPQESIRSLPRPFWCQVTQYPPEGSTLSFLACSLVARRSQLQGVHPRLLGRL